MGYYKINLCRWLYLLTKLRPSIIMSAKFGCDWVKCIEGDGV